MAQELYQNIFNKSYKRETNNINIAKNVRRPK